MFQKPNPNHIISFFAFHPQQPEVITPFISKKTFYKQDKTLRFWLTYNGEALFCSVCLAFGIEMNSFILGMSTWSHVHQRIIEHE